MKPVKRVEIVADSVELDAILEILEQAGVSGYTIIKDVTGKGGRGARRGDELTGVFNNSYVLTACSEEEAVRVAEGIRPLLEKFGGVCLVSDAMWILH